MVIDESVSGLLYGSENWVIMSGYAYMGCFDHIVRMKTESQNKYTKESKDVTR